MARSHIDAFRKWLRLQIDRNDPVGDFARDFLMDDCAEDVTTISSLDRHLRDDHDVTDGVLEARDRAWREYAAKAKVQPLSPSGGTMRVPDGGKQVGLRSVGLIQREPGPDLTAWLRERGETPRTRRVSCLA